MNDRQLVNNFLDHRDEKAFRALYKSKTPHLYKMAFRLTQNKSLADDLIQEMWIIAIKKLDKFQWRSALKTWLTGILLNLFRSRWKNPEKEVNLEVDTQRMETNIESRLIDTFDLETAIAKLPPGYRQIIILHDIEGYTHHEIAHLLGIKEGTSKSQLFHARKTLRKYLNEDFIKYNKYE
jgi:RNA polymerase sigma-70 factor (ECF subfamily)